MWDQGVPLEHWEEQGEVRVGSLPDTSLGQLPLKVFSLGYNAMGDRSTGLAMVRAWRRAYGERVNVIILAWDSLAGHALYEYDDAARNAIDVGTYFGLCLASLSLEQGVRPDLTHLVGFSLGAHLVGASGRAYTTTTGLRLARLTGLDPAIGRFFGVVSPPEVQNQKLAALPELVTIIP